MRAKKLKEIYSKEWEIIEEAVLSDVHLQFDLKRIQHSGLEKKAEVVAYNAAFMACSLLHKLSKVGF